MRKFGTVIKITPFQGGQEPKVRPEEIGRILVTSDETGGKMTNTFENPEVGSI